MGITEFGLMLLFHPVFVLLEIAVILDWIWTHHTKHKQPISNPKTTEDHLRRELLLFQARAFRAEQENARLKRKAAKYNIHL